MEDSNIIDLIAIETIAPKHRIIRSLGAIYIALILLIIGCISLGNLLYDRFQISRYITQPVLYALIVVFGYVIYQRHYVSFRYTLTSETFAIERIANAEQTIGVIPIHDITLIWYSREKERPTGKIVCAVIPGSKEITWIKAVSEGTEITYRICASAAFAQQLLDTWHKTTQISNETD